MAEAAVPEQTQALTAQDKGKELAPSFDRNDHRKGFFDIIIIEEDKPEYKPPSRPVDPKNKATEDGFRNLFRENVVPKGQVASDEFAGRLEFELFDDVAGDYAAIFRKNCETGAYKFFKFNDVIPKYYAHAEHSKDVQQKARVQKALRTIYPNEDHTLSKITTTEERRSIDAASQNAPAAATTSGTTEAVEHPAPPASAPVAAATSSTPAPQVTVTPAPSAPATEDNTSSAAAASTSGANGTNTSRFPKRFSLLDKVGSVFNRDAAPAASANGSAKKQIFKSSVAPPKKTVDEKKKEHEEKVVELRADLTAKQLAKDAKKNAEGNKALSFPARTETKRSHNDGGLISAVPGATDFFITNAPAQWLDDQYVVIGKLSRASMMLLARISGFGTKSGVPAAVIFISKSGLKD